MHVQTVLGRLAPHLMGNGTGRLALSHVCLQRKLVTRGDVSAKVAALCGPPTQIEHSSIYRASTAWVAGQVNRGATTTIEIPVEIWLYNLGSDKLMQQIRFEDGRVVNIESLGYGYNEDN